MRDVEGRHHDRRAHHERGGEEQVRRVAEQPERAARIIRRGLAKGRRQIAFPYPLYLGMLLIRALPAGLVDPILRRAAVDIGPYV